jgi:hypothetical protein
MKCPSCNLVNFRDATSCKRCGRPLPQEAENVSIAGNLGRVDNLLVVRSSPAFPDRCLKCNQPSGEKHQTTVLRYYPKYNFISLLLGVLFYKKIQLKIPLCRKHIGARTNISMILSVLLVMGVIVLMIGLCNLNVILIVFGGILVGISVLVDAKTTPLTVVKMSNDEMWIKGAGEKFLATLPVIEEQKQ